MTKMITFGSSSTGNISGFAAWMREWDETVSFTVDDGFNFRDTSSFRVLHQIEPPEVLDVVDRIIENHKFYDLILAWNKRVLNACPNARLFPHGNCTWMNPEYKPWLDTAGKKVMECDASKKKFKASFITSSKVQTPGHVLRQEIYEKLPSRINDLTIFKHKSPPYLPSKKPLLDDYQFHITPQNASQDNWFDDKLSDSLMAKTIPLYWGCPNVSDFFNMDGIIQFKTYDEMIQKLGELTPEYYWKHYDAVQDNFERALKLVHIWHRVEVEIDAGLERKKQNNSVTEKLVNHPVRPLRRFQR